MQPCTQITSRVPDRQLGLLAMSKPIVNQLGVVARIILSVVPPRSSPAKREGTRRRVCRGGLPLVSDSRDGPSHLLEVEHAAFCLAIP